MRIARALGRIVSWAVLAPSRQGLGLWSGLRPAQQLALGFASYVAVGTVLLSLPVSTVAPVALIDHVFVATSAMSTTGLATISISDSYTFFGELVVLALFQLGGIGYMTLSSVIVLARGRTLSEGRAGVLAAGFALPRYFVMHRFVVHVIVFTLIAETVGALLLWWRFSVLGVDNALWSAVFHSVSAFATAGFSLYNNSLEGFGTDWVVCLTVGALCYLGAIGFIVVQDVWYSVKFREHMVTFTSKVIVLMTGVVFVVLSLWLYFADPGLGALPGRERLIAAVFQAMTASTTAGFNTVPIGGLSAAALVVLMVAMVIGASPSGTGGGIKTTTVSALLACVLSILRGRDRVSWLGHEVPMVRVVNAVASATVYLCLLIAGLAVLCLTEGHGYLPVLFEAASAIGTVGLSLGITGELSYAGKVVVVVLMFAGRCGPLTLGLALLRPREARKDLRPDDLAV